jgi:hypothetical protein
MGKYARKFFIMTIFSAFGLFMMSMNPSGVKALKGAIGMISTLRTGKMPTPTDNSPENQEFLKQMMGILNKKQQVANLDEESDVSSSSRVEPTPELAAEDIPRTVIVEIAKNGQPIQQDDASEQEYVQINGHYYPARKDNTYIVNGEKIFHLNGRKYSRSELTGVSSGQDLASSSKIQSGVNPASAKMSDSTPATESAPMGSSIDSVKVLQDMQQAQKRIEEQRKYLEQLANEK